VVGRTEVVEEEVAVVVVDGEMVPKHFDLDALSSQNSWQTLTQYSNHQRFTRGCIHRLCFTFCTLITNAFGEIYIANLCSSGIQNVSNHADHARCGDLQAP